MPNSYPANNHQLTPVQGQDDLVAETEKLRLENLDMLKRLRLSGASLAYQEHYCNIDFCKMGFSEQLNLILKCELTRRSDRSFNRRLKAANLDNHFTPEQVRDHLKDFNLSPSSFEMVMSNRWVCEGRLLLILGKCGVGKTSLAGAIIEAQCRNGYSAKAYDYTLLMYELTEAYGKNGSHSHYQKLLEDVAKNDVILFDDVRAFDVREGEGIVFKDLLHVCRIKNHCGLVCTAQKTPDQWHKELGGSILADAVIDRIFNQSCLIQLDGESHRSTSPEVLSVKQEGKI